MNDKDLSLISLSKITTHEILIDEQIGQLGTVRFRYFKRFLANHASLKRRFILSKIFGAVIFGILPIIPLLTYFEVLDFINTGVFPVELILFAGSLLFGIFFVFQFFNFFLMAMLNTMKILSGSIFEWFETLPISREKLKKLILLTIIRSLDIPLIVITFSFPIIMFIGTQNVFIFFTSIGVSILETIFSLSLLILFSERLNRVLNINKVDSKKTHIIRLINLASYIIIVIGSVFLIQWALNSIESFFILFFQSQSPRLIVMILSMIPFPIAPGYLLSSFIAPLRIPGFMWYNIIIGSALYVILTYLIYQLSLKGIKKSSFSKLKKKNDPDDVGIKKQVNIKIVSPLWAYVRKDIIIASRNLKTFLALVMPIVIGFIFSFTYNNTNIGGVTPFQINFIFNMFVLIGFNLIISGMIINGLLSMEESGTAILASLPLIPREQANAKLILMFSIQIITVLAPSLMYIGTNVFFNSLTTALWSLPLVLLFLFIMFNMRIYFFGKSKNKFLIEEVLPEKKIGKWALIFIIEYSIYILTLAFAFLFYTSGGGMMLITFINFYSIIGILLSYLVFQKIFSIKRTEKTTLGIIREIPFEGRPTWFTKHIWITSLILVSFNIFFFYLISFIPIPPMPYLLVRGLGYELYKLFYLFMFNFLFVLLWIIVNPIFIGTPYGILSIGAYFKKITSDWDKYKAIKFIICISIALVVLYLSYYVIINYYFYGIPIRPEYANYYLYIIIYTFCIYFWQGFFFIGIVFMLFLKKLKSWLAILLISVVYSIFNPRFLLLILSSPYLLNDYSFLLTEWLFSFIPGLLSALVYMKVKNIFIISSIFLTFEYIVRFFTEVILYIPYIY